MQPVGALISQLVPSVRYRTEHPAPTPDRMGFLACGQRRVDPSLPRQFPDSRSVARLCRVGAVPLTLPLPWLGLQVRREAITVTSCGHVIPVENLSVRVRSNLRSDAKLPIR